jgi:hypothetical protein
LKSQYQKNYSARRASNLQYLEMADEKTDHFAFFQLHRKMGMNFPSNHRETAK